MTRCGEWGCEICCGWGAVENRWPGKYSSIVLPSVAGPLMVEVFLRIRAPASLYSEQEKPQLSGTTCPPPSISKWTVWKL